MVSTNIIFDDFCGFWSVAVNTVEKLQFLASRIHPRLAAWRIVVSVVRRMNEVTLNSTSGPASTGMGDCLLQAGTSSRYVTNQLGQIGLASLRGR